MVTSATSYGEDGFHTFRTVKLLIADKIKPPPPPPPPSGKNESKSIVAMICYSKKYLRYAKKTRECDLQSGK